MATNPVYDWLDSDGRSTGCGTALEIAYWAAEGINPDGRPGAVLCHEPASEDARRIASWNEEAFVKWLASGEPGGDYGDWLVDRNPVLHDAVCQLEQAA